MSTHRTANPEIGKNNETQNQQRKEKSERKIWKTVIL